MLATALRHPVTNNRFQYQSVWYPNYKGIRFPLNPSLVKAAIILQAPALIYPDPAAILL